MRLLVGVLPGNTRSFLGRLPAGLLLLVLLVLSSRVRHVPDPMSQLMSLRHDCRFVLSTSECFLLPSSSILMSPS
jgi:hypothetical protein